MIDVKPMPAADALDRYFLELRCRLLDVAAILDRIDRGGSLPGEPRLQKVYEALAVLSGPGPDRAEAIQHIFSRSYEEKWERPAKRR